MKDLPPYGFDDRSGKLHGQQSDEDHIESYHAIFAVFLLWSVCLDGSWEVW